MCVLCVSEHERKPRVRKETGSMKGNQERERRTGAQNYEREKARSANTKEQNLRPKKEHKSASAKGSTRGSESASAKAQKSACPALLLVQNHGVISLAVVLDQLRILTATSKNRFLHTQFILEIAFIIVEDVAGRNVQGAPAIFGIFYTLRNNNTAQLKNIRFYIY